MALAVAAWLLVGAGVLRVSAAALPGDPLYGVKRATEAMRLAITLNAQGDAQLQLSFARQRIAEMDALAGTGRAEDLAVAAAGYQDAVAAVEVLLARAPQVARIVISSQADAELRLAELAERAPQDTRGAIEQALRAAQDVRERARVVLDESNDRTATPPPAPGPVASGAPLPTHTVGPSVSLPTANAPMPSQTHPPRPTATMTAQRPSPTPMPSAAPDLNNAGPTRTMPPSTVTPLPSSSPAPDFSPQPTKPSTENLGTPRPTLPPTRTAAPTSVTTVGPTQKPTWPPTPNVAPASTPRPTVTSAPSADQLRTITATASTETSSAHPDP